MIMRCSFQGPFKLRGCVRLAYVILGTASAYKDRAEFSSEKSKNIIMNNIDNHLSECQI
jgi:hypothetical protein